MPRLKRKPSQIVSGTSCSSQTEVIRCQDIHSSWYYSSQRKKSKKVQLVRIDQLFESYANKSSGFIEPEGIETLCKDVLVDYNDIRMLILAWKMEAEKQGFFSKNEWRRGLKFLGADTIRELKSEIHMIEKEVMLPKAFEDFYSYAFQYNLIKDKQRTLDIKTACELLNVVLRHLFPTKVDLLIEFLKIQNEYGALNRDQWRSFYHFVKECQESMLDLQNYDPSQSWPVIIDNFVEWLKEKEKKI